MNDDDDLQKHFAKNLKKSKGKVVAGKLLEQQKEEDQKREKRLKKKTEASNEPMSNLLRKTKEDEDWEDLPEQRDIDLKNIRVGNLGLPKEGDGEPSSEDVGASKSIINETGKFSSTNPEVPWSMKAAATSELPVSVSMDSPEKIEDEKTSDEAIPEKPKEAEIVIPTGKGSYVPPHMRSKTSSDKPQSGVPHVKRIVHHQKPNLNDTEEFPTLGMASASADMTEKQRIAMEKTEVEQGWQKASSGAGRTGGVTATPTTPSSERSNPGIYQPPRPSGVSGTGTSYTPKADAGKSNLYVPPHMKSSSGSQKQSMGESRSFDSWRSGGDSSTRGSENAGQTRTSQFPTSSNAASSGLWSRKDTSMGSQEKRDASGKVITKTDLELHNRFTELTTGQE